MAGGCEVAGSLEQPKARAAKVVVAARARTPRPREEPAPRPSEEPALRGEVVVSEVSS